MATHGKQNWVVVAKSMPGRGGKQCRERYTNKLAPDVKGGEWTEEEDALLFQKHRELGNKWAEMGSDQKRTDEAWPVAMRWSIFHSCHENEALCAYATLCPWCIFAEVS